MSFFPLFTDIDNKKILLIGGGRVGERKLNTLLLFTKNITVISPEITKGISKAVEEHSLSYKKREFKKKDLKGFDWIVVTADNLKLQKEIYKISIKKGLECNCSADVELCTFIFPAIIKKGDIVVAVSSSGTSPGFTKDLKNYIESVIPGDLETQLKESAKKRKRDLK